jgi:6-phosphogluconolactonase
VSRTTDVDVQVFPDARVAAEAAGGMLAEAVDAGGHIVVSGGTSPRIAYERAAELRPDWTGVDLWWADERCVPPDDERSNYRLVADTLLTRLDRLPTVHRTLGELAPELAADDYDAALGGVTLSFALLGIGADGHTCSLFPGMPALDERGRRAVATEAGLEPFVPRVTLTIPAVSAAGLVVYLATGASKADAVLRAFERPPSPATPASLVRGESTVALLDEEAAALLRG